MTKQFHIQYDFKIPIKYFETLGSWVIVLFYGIEPIMPSNIIQVTDSLGNYGK